VTVSARPRAHARRRERCPSCEIPAQRGQLICLSCGTRMALDRGGRGDRRAVVVASAVMALVAVVSLALVVDGLSGGEERRVASASPAERTEPARRAKASAPISDEALVREHAARARRQLAMSAGDWPAGREGWTVVLVNTGDEESARSYAQSVEESGVEAGVLSAAEHPNLGSDLWIVFSGVYDDQLEAGNAAAELQTKFGAAYPQFVQ
jgi:sporulation related protein